MEHIETNQTQRSEALTELMDEIRRQVGIRPLHFRRDVLAGLLDELRPSIEAVDKLAAMESKVRQIFDSLDAKSKAVIAVLEKLTVLESEGIDIKYGNEIENDFLHSREYIEQAVKQYPQDKDLACLNEVYGLAEFVLEAEEEGRQPASQTKAKESQTVEAAETKDENAEPEKGGDPALQTIKQWMARRTYTEKLAGVLMLELSKKHGEFDEPDDDIGSDIINEWRETVIKMSGDPEYLKEADSEEVAVTASTTMMLYWEV
jgi:hypothetical protein